MSTYTKFVLGVCGSGFIGCFVLAIMKGLLPEIYSTWEYADKFFLMSGILFVGMVVCFISSYAEDLMVSNDPLEDLENI